MKPICCMCGRRTTPAAFIGAEAIGPTCAKNIGLPDAAKLKKNSRVRLVKYKPVKQPEPKNLELFDDEHRNS